MEHFTRKESGILVPYNLFQPEAKKGICDMFGGNMAMGAMRLRLVKFKIWGSAGGSGNNQLGGAGGYAEYTDYFLTGTQFNIVVGGGGKRDPRTGDGSSAGGNGGALSGVFLGQNSFSQASAIAIAGSGGGAGNAPGAGGAGGGANGQHGIDTNGGAACGAGGSPSIGGDGGNSLGSTDSGGSAGTALTGGDAGNPPTDFARSWPNGSLGGKYLSQGGGGGGGGWYGGGGGGTESPFNGNNLGSGGGGSGYLKDSAKGTLIAGSGSTPGNSADADRGTAGTSVANNTDSGNGYGGGLHGRIVVYVDGLKVATYDYTGANQLYMVS